MVYCGKPSQACHQCRARNIKCDKKRDSCGQCLRARRNCPGYHDPKLLVFRDQTETVIKKTLKREKPSIPEAIIIPIEERAKRMFLAQYVFGDLPLLDYMPQFYPHGLKDYHLGETIRAVCLAFFSSEVTSPSLLHMARKRYGHALSLTNKALQSSHLAMKDTMLLTVLLLHLFECLASKNEISSLDSEMRHIDGAIALVKLRGTQQFSDAIRLRMFLHLNLNILMRCLQHEVDVPSELISLRACATHFANTNDSAWQFTDLMVRYSGLRSAIRLGEYSNIEIIQVATQIDRGLLDIYTNIRPDWQPSRVTSIVHCNGLAEHIHIYPSYSICKTWNTIRLVRILVNEVIHDYSQRCLSKKICLSDFNFEALHQESLKIIVSLISDICASLAPDTDRDSKFSMSTFSDRVGAQTLIFPLYIAASSSFCPKEIRHCIIGRLEVISSQMSIPQATMVKKILDGRKRDNPWGIAGMLGGASIILMTSALPQLGDSKSPSRVFTFEELEQMSDSRDTVAGHE